MNLDFKFWISILNLIFEYKYQFSIWISISNSKIARKHQKIYLTLTHFRNTLRTPLIHPWYTLETPLKHPWNTFETPLKHPWNTLETPLKHTSTPIDSLWHSLMLYDTPNALQTSKTLKKKKGDVRTNLVTTSLLELLVAAKNNFKLVQYLYFCLLKQRRHAKTILPCLFEPLWKCWCDVIFWPYPSRCQ